MNGSMSEILEAGPAMRPFRLMCMTGNAMSSQSGLARMNVLLTLIIEYDS